MEGEFVIEFTGASSNVTGGACPPVAHIGTLVAYLKCTGFRIVAPNFFGTSGDETEWAVGIAGGRVALGNRNLFGGDCRTARRYGRQSDVILPFKCKARRYVVAFEFLSGARFPIRDGAAGGFVYKYQRIGIFARLHLKVWRRDVP